MQKQKMEKISGNYLEDHLHLYNKLIHKLNYMDNLLHLMLYYFVKYIKYLSQKILDHKKEDNKL